MPFIDSRITVPVAPETKEEIKSALGQLIATLHKSETYLMVGIEDNYDLWLGGKKLEKGAYVAVSLYGSAPSEAYDKLTGQICWKMQTEDMLIQNEYKKTGGRRFLRGQAADGKVSLCGAEKSVGVLHALAECNCLVEMPQTGQPVKVGDTVKVYYL